MGNQALRSCRTSGALVACKAIRRAPRTSMTWISPPARSGWAWRSPSLPRSCRTILRANGRQRTPLGRMVALIGDAELDEGNIYEACKKAGSTICATSGGSSTTTGRASTASCARGCFGRIEAIFAAFGWHVVKLKYGAAAARGLCGTRRRAAAGLDRRLPQCPLLGADLSGRRGVAQALDGRSWRSGRCYGLIARRTDAELAD